MLFTPALYMCNSDALVMLIPLFVGAKRTSPRVITYFVPLVYISPAPKITTKMEGLGVAGNSVAPPWGR